MTAGSPYLLGLLLSLRLTLCWCYAPPDLFRANRFIRRSYLQSSSPYNRRTAIVRYEPSSEQPEISYSDSSGVWSALAATEKWIVQTLTTSGGVAGSNPYTRKEVSYVCEIARESSMVVASLFRRVREARELGESYALADKAALKDRGPDARPSTFRQTQVIVIPWCKEAASYPFFDTLLQAVNRARRNSKDFFTDVSPSHGSSGSVDPVMAKDKELLAISINIACLHPQFGKKTPKQLLEEMRQEENEGEIDVNLKEYIEQRNRARQSPFPTFVLEVRATPPIFPTQVTSSTPTTSPMQGGSDSAPKSGDLADIAKLQALFGLPAATKKHPTSDVEQHTTEDDFYDRLSMAFGEREVFIESPMTMSQNWIGTNDPFFNMSTCTFTLSESKHVDASYEFVFNNIAMHISMGRGTTSVERKLGTKELKFSTRSYLVMPHFLSSSATSFEKFAGEVANIVQVLGLQDILSVSIMHPEHIQSERRSPCPIFVLQWFHQE